MTLAAPRPAPALSGRRRTQTNETTTETPGVWVDRRGSRHRHREVSWGGSEHVVGPGSGGRRARRPGRRPLRTERFRRVAVGGEWVGGDEADLDPGRRDALLLAGEEGDGADVGDGGPVLVQGPRPQAGVANGGDLGRVDQRLADQV